MRKIKSPTLHCAAVLGLVSIVSLGGACTQKSLLAGDAVQPTDAKTEKAVTTTGGTSPQIEAAQKLIEKAPDAANGYNRLAAVYIRQARETGDFSLNSKAEANVSRALEKEPNNSDSLKLKASLLLTFHRFKEALDFAAGLQKQYPRDSFVYGVLTDANVELGNYPEAVNTAQMMVDLKPNTESYSRVSYIRSLHGATEGAIEAMKHAARIADPRDKEAQAWCLVHLGDEYFKVGRYREAENSFDEALQILPDYYLALAGKGRVRAAQNDFETGIKFLTAAQNRVPLTDTAISLGDIYTRINNREEAQKQYDLAQFIEQKFDNTEQRTLALFWADRDMKLDEALEIARRESAARKDIYTADILAWCLYKKGDFADAKKAITDAMRLKTKDARILYHAGMIEKALGNRKAAAQLLKQSLEINPAFDFVQSENAKLALNELSRNA